MNPTSPKTYLVLLNVLTRKNFSQRELARDLDVSVGHTNNVVRWLEENRFVERQASSPGKRRSYTVVNPTGLLRAVSLFRPMEQLRRFSLSIDLHKEQLMALLSERQAIFCLGSALERYSEFYRPDEVSFYALGQSGSNSPDVIREDLSARREGITKVSCYGLETKLHGRRRETPRRESELLDYLERAGFVERAGRGLFTSKVQTVIDFFCDGKAFAVRDLLAHIWGVEL